MTKNTFFKTSDCSFRAIVLKLFSILLSALFLIAIAATVSNAAEVTLAWDRNSETAVIGYRLHYGTVSRKYTHFQDVGDQTRYTLTELKEGVTYYFAVTAYIDNNDESDYSDEISYLADYTGLRITAETECSDDVDCHSGHVCDLESGECVECLFDEHCDDGIFCNGVERCSRNVCQPGSYPCENFEWCDDGICYAAECFDDADCDDGLFCNGPEQCVAGTCSEQAPACSENEFCVEDIDACLEYPETTSWCLPLGVRKPIFHQQRCKGFLVLANNSQCMTDADQREIHITFPDDPDAAGVMFDAFRSINAFGPFLFLPVCIDQSAPSGEWLITIVNSCGALSQPFKEITQSAFILQ